MDLARETDETVASKVRVSRVQISRIRRGLSKPSPRLASELERVTGIPAWEFVRPQDQPAADAA